MYAGAPYAGAPYAGSGTTVETTVTLPRVFGLWLDSTTAVDVTPPFTPASVPVVLHIVAPTVPTPTLVDGRPA